MVKPMFIDRANLARLIGCGVGTLNAMVERGELPRPMQLTKGARIRFIRAELEPVLQQRGIDLAKLETVHVEGVTCA
ncbi:MULTISPECIES: helix-turn-helix transcriptional regulator [Aeromonas]|uniref:helix-turn-helix transcriptional regulator n=1 Tax=Aeromonas TaxID=642 RepID=UPI0038D1DAD2